MGGYREGEEASQYNKKTLTERWNGTSWSIVSSPNPSGHKGSELLEVYASAGMSELLATEEKTLVESGNGSEWAIQTSPNPEGRKLSRLTGVSCSSSTSCKAVGWGKKSISEGDTVTLGEKYE